MSWTTRTSTGLRNVHERDVTATPTEVWEQLATLSSPDDRVWPSDRWPRLRLSGGLAPGSHGGHGPIRYRVTSIAPESSLVFTFEPGGGISGRHSFTLTPTDTGTRVTHVAELEHPSTMVAAVIVPLHDALLEDLLDQLEAVLEQRELTRRPLPLAVRARLSLIAAARAHPSPAAVTGRRRALVAATATTLGAIGALHLVWGLGSAWPARSREQHSPSSVSPS